MSVRNHSQSVQNESGQLNLFTRDEGTSNIYAHTRTLRFEPEGCLVYGPGSREVTINTSFGTGSSVVPGDLLWEPGTGGDSIKAKNASTLAAGDRAVAHGFSSNAYDSDCYAGGNRTTAVGRYSHAEGSSTLAFGIQGSHAEGWSSKAIGVASHAEGRDSNAAGDYSHSEGDHTISIGVASHAEGLTTNAYANSSHAEGEQTLAKGTHSHAEGKLTTASGAYSHAEGHDTHAEGNFSHAEGEQTHAKGDHSYAGGTFSNAQGSNSHAEGNMTFAIGADSHVEGRDGVAHGNYSHAEGLTGNAYGVASHAEGRTTNAYADYSHAEGFDTIASGIASHAEGRTTIASGDNSHAGGNRSKAEALTSFATGESALVDSSSLQSSVLGGQTNTIYESTNAGIIGGTGNIVDPGHNNTIILGGTSLRSGATDTVYAGNHLEVGTYFGGLILGSILRVSGIYVNSWEDGHFGNATELWFTASDFSAVEKGGGLALLPTAICSRITSLPFGGDAPCVGYDINVYPAAIPQFSAQKIIPKGFEIWGEARFYFQGIPSWMGNGSIEVAYSKLDAPGFGLVPMNTPIGNPPGVNPLVGGVPAPPGGGYGTGRIAVTAIVTGRSSIVNREELMSVMIPIRRV